VDSFKGDSSSKKWTVSMGTVLQKVAVSMGDSFSEWIAVNRCLTREWFLIKNAVITTKAAFLSPAVLKFSTKADISRYFY
jgi:hypothetical protein